MRYTGEMTKLFPVSDKDLLARTAERVGTERASGADVIEHLAEIDRRRAYLDAACRSLSCYCVERLGYSEDEARKRVQVARSRGASRRRSKSCAPDASI